MSFSNIIGCKPSAITEEDSENVFVNFTWVFIVPEYTVRRSSALEDEVVTVEHSRTWKSDEQSLKCHNRISSFRDGGLSQVKSYKWRKYYRNAIPVRLRIVDCRWCFYLRFSSNGFECFSSTLNVNQPICGSLFIKINALTWNMYTFYVWRKQKT